MSKIFKAFSKLPQLKRYLINIPPEQTFFNGKLPKSNVGELFFARQQDKRRQSRNIPFFQQCRNTRV